MAPTPLSRHRLRGPVLAVLMLVLDLVGPGMAPALAQEGEVTRSRVEAAYLVKFTDFVSWPARGHASADSPLVLTVVADDALARDLELATAGKQVHGRPLHVRRHDPGSRVGETQVLFIGAAARPHAAELLREVQGRPVLTVSDHPEVHALGTMVNFVIVDDRVRFDVALRHAQAAGVQISALMLTAARTVAGSGR